MTIKKLVSFGCSWTYGDELLDPALAEDNIEDHYSQNNAYRLSHCFAGLTAQAYGLEFENMAFPGSSLESMAWNLMWYLKSGLPQDNVIFLVGLTDATRRSWYNPQHRVAMADPGWNRHMHSTWLAQPNPDIDENWYKLQKLWLGMSYHKEWAEFNYMQTINLFDQAQSRYGIPVIQINCLPNPYPARVPTLIYPGLNFRDILLEKTKTENLKLYAPKGHPNELGHQKVADHLIEHIKYSKILG